MNDTREELDIFLLEEVFNEDLKCEIEHIETTCSVKVTAKIKSTCDQTSYLACQNAIDSALIDMESPIVICDLCGRLAGKCWRIIPI